MGEPWHRFQRAFPEARNNQPVGGVSITLRTSGCDFLNQENRDVNGVVEETSESKSALIGVWNMAKISKQIKWTRHNSLTAEIVLLKVWLPEPI
jgi:hypothetical protein